MVCYIFMLGFSPIVKTSRIASRSEFCLIDALDLGHSIIFLVLFLMMRKNREKI